MSHDTLLVKKLPPVKKDAGYVLRVFRAIHNMTQADAAAFFGLKPSHWSLLETGTRNLSPTKAYEVAAVVGCDEKLLMGVIKVVK